MRQNLIHDNVIPNYINDRYSKWDSELGNLIHDKSTNLEILSDKVIKNNINPEPKSGQQELLENILNKYL